MFFLRSIVLAAAALATVASAIPAGVIPSVGGSPVGSEGSGPESGVGGSGVPAGGLPGLDGVIPGLPVKRGQSSSPGDRMQQCHDDMKGYIDEIKTTCNCGSSCKDGKPDGKLVVDLLLKISAVLEDTLRDLKVIVVAELQIKGVVCTLQELAKLIASILIIVIELVYLVLITLGSTVEGLLVVIGQIGACLCDILRCLLNLLPGLKVEIAVIIKAYVAHIQYLKFLDILKILAITY